MTQIINATTLKKSEEAKNEVSPPHEATMKQEGKLQIDESDEEIVLSKYLQNLNISKWFKI